MNSKTYTIKKGTIVQALEDIDAFIENIETLKLERPEKNYQYDIVLDETEGSGFEITLTLTKDE